MRPASNAAKTTTERKHVSTLPSPHRIVIGARAHTELAERLHAARRDLEIRGSSTSQVSADDLSWADTYVGFMRPALPTMGNVRWVHCTGAGVDAGGVAAAG